ncbi:hypothetical protein [Weissella paramesenteroides]|uniref:hypothetical protein n=1 Tax=Weissella paramesenteroides TaxID=1249 RepID=UPI002072CB04|nr:hypothetical protein [Weissella paramesenteroides]MCM6765377.1 hypothetical protein [Weissella paramesenteroides]MCM6766748.1 hypothetical protein [Weissella paramesenteroides]MCM6769169.1 hypothetical protein [Weissella paramesenteroides]MCM6771488.1 hypothetical protein [Weissella paramesenteroides]MCM6779419.1 hypothetical protein [Weissella paramesenteroides]
MNKTIVVSTAVVVIVAAAGGGTYAVLHTPKRQFASNLVKMTKSDDNIANFRVTASGTGDDTGSASGTLKADAQNENNLAVHLKVNDKNTPEAMNIKMDKKHVYVSADLLTSSVKSYGSKGLTEATKSLDKYWLDASRSVSLQDTYSPIKAKEVRSDATSVTEWFKDLDSSKFKKVSNGYQVNLNKADMKSLMTRISKTKSGKELSKSEWKEAKSALDPVKNFKLKLTVGDKGKSFALDFSGKENNRKERLTFKVNTKRDNNLKVKMPAKSLIKTETQLTALLQDKMIAYYSDQIDATVDEFDSSSSTSSLNDDILDA